MTAMLAIAFTATLIFVGPRLAARLFDRRAPSRTVAAFHLLALTGAAMLPLLVLACLILLRGGRPHEGAAAAPSGLRGLALAAGVAYLAWLASSVRRTLCDARRVSAESALAAGARVEPRAGARILVLPTERPVAYAAAGWSGGVIVSEGLLRLLDERDRESAIEHEFAHLRLGHHRLLLYAHVVRRALGRVPPVRRSFASLRRELEAIADETAVEVVGDRSVVARALAKVALAHPAVAPSPAFGDPEDLAYRIERLTSPHPPEDRRHAAAAAVGLLGTGLVVAQCAAFHPSTLAAGVALCGASVTWLALRAGRRPARG